MQNSRISFRAGATLAEALAHRAERAGCSVSEYLRSIVRDHVGLSDPPPPLNIAAPPPPSFTDAAARGSANAFAELACRRYQSGLDGYDLPITSLAKAIEYGRLAVSARNAPEDRNNLIFLIDRYAEALDGIGQHELADRAQGEAVALAEAFALDGDEAMAQLVAGSADALSPNVLTIAGELIENAKGVLNAEPAIAEA